jgi:hypothetical protein
MKSTELRQLIKESIKDYVREIENSGNKAALEAKIAKIDEAIEKRKKKLNMDGLDEDMKDMIHPNKLKEVQKEINELEKSKTKYQSQLEKMEGKNEPEMEVEDEEKEIVDEVNIEENEPENGPQLEDEEPLCESFLYMQKLAGVLTESQYNLKLIEAKKKPSEGMTKKQKSSVVKKARAGKDIGKKGKGFEKVEKAAEKEYGSEEAGKKVAGSVLWKARAAKARAAKKK